MTNDFDSLVCPMNHMPLKYCSHEQTAELNRAISRGQVRNQAGERVECGVDGLLVRDDKLWLYPVRRGIPCLLHDEAIPAESINTHGSEVSP